MFLLLSAQLRLGRFLRNGLLTFLGRRGAAADERRGILRVEGQTAHAPLSCRAQGYVYAPVVRQPDRPSTTALIGAGLLTALLTWTGVLGSVSL